LVKSKTLIFKKVTAMKTSCSASVAKKQEKPKQKKQSNAEVRSAVKNSWGQKDAKNKEEMKKKKDNFRKVVKKKK